MSKGSFLCLYAGEIISTVEARRRWERQKAAGQGNYILVINEHISVTGVQQTLKTTVDPTKIGNVGRFMSMTAYCLCPSLQLTAAANRPCLPTADYACDAPGPSGRQYRSTACPVSRKGD